MGKLLYSDVARLMALTSGTWAVWAGMWAVAYRKFFWDMIGAELGPASLIPTPQAASFLAMIVSAPVVQAFVILFGLATLLLEWGFPFVTRTGAGRSIVLRIVFYVLFAALEVLLYQGVDGAVYYLITASVYTRALLNGETLSGAVTSHDVSVEGDTRQVKAVV